MNKNIEEVYRLHATSVYRYCMYRVRSQQEAEDICSEVFSTFIAKKEAQEIKDIKFWLFGVARNIICGKYRSTGKYEQVVDEAWIAQMEDEESGGVEEELVDLELIDEMKSEMEKLNDEEREIIMLKIWEVMTFSQIAQLINVNVSNVKATYYKALDKIRLNMQKRERKFRVFTLPMLVAAISGLKTSIAAPDNLFNLINLKVMDTTSQIPVVTSSNWVSDLWQASRSYIITSVVTTAVLGTVGGVVYTVANNKPEPTPTTTPTPVVTEVIAPTEIMPTAVIENTQVPLPTPVEWITYKIEHQFDPAKVELQFAYPADWAISNVVDTAGSRTVTLKKGNGYILTFSYLNNSDGGVSCSYTDYYIDPNSGPLIEQMPDKWTEIKGTHSLFRRTLSSMGTLQQDVYQVCRLKNRTFSTDLPGILRVTTPKNSSNSSDMKIIDQIIATIK